jgi:hypothetical protein
MSFNLASQRFSAYLRRLVQTPLSQVEDELLIRLALDFWYTSIDLEAEIRLFLASQPKLENIYRAGYLIQRLTRFTCATDGRVSEALDALRLLKKPQIFDNKPVGDRGNGRVDVLAREWGLSEGLGLKVQSILPYQTRHFEATQRAPMIGSAVEESPIPSKPQPLK